MNDRNFHEDDPKSDLLDSTGKRSGYAVPEGYAEELQHRLKSIPDQSESAAPKVVRHLANWKIWSLAAAAACLLAAVLILPQKEEKPTPCTTFDCMVEAWAEDENALRDLPDDFIASRDLHATIDVLDMQDGMFASIDDTTMVLFLTDGYLSDLELYGLLEQEQQ
jgi:hypothetical protein